MTTPDEVAGLVLWLRADTGVYQDAAMTIPATADGTMVKGWADQSGEGNDAVHATQGPVLKLSIRNGYPVLRGDGTPKWLSVAAPHTIPPQAPVTVFVVGVCDVPAFATGRKRMCSFQAFGNIGWAYGQAIGYAQSLLTLHGITEKYSSTPCYGADQWAVHAMRFDTSFDVQFWVNGGDRGTIACGSDATNGNIAFRVLGSGNGGEDWDGDVAEIAIYAAEASDEDVLALTAYWCCKYNLPLAPNLNAATYQATPTYDGSNQVVHPDVYYNASGWHGYKYWMAVTPFPDSDAGMENPSILACNDGASWEVPAGLVNPVVAAPGGGAYNADPDLLVSPNRVMWLIYEENMAGNYSRVYVRSSADGITWSAATLILNLTFSSCLSPAVVWDGSQYVMWSVDHSGGLGVLERRTCATMTGTWSAASPCTISNPVTNYNWHLDVILVDGIYIMLLQKLGGVTERDGLYLLTSSDGITWEYDINFRLAVGEAGAWDSTQIYRGSIVYTGVYEIWYSALKTNGTDVWHVGRATNDSVWPFLLPPDSSEETAACCELRHGPQVAQVGRRQACS